MVVDLSMVIVLGIIRHGESMGNLVLGVEAGYLLTGKVFSLSEMMM